MSKPLEQDDSALLQRAIKEALEAEAEKMIATIIEKKRGELDRELQNLEDTLRRRLGEVGLTIFENITFERLGREIRIVLTVPSQKGAQG